MLLLFLCCWLDNQRAFFDVLISIYKKMDIDNETGELIKWSYDKETGEHFSMPSGFKIPPELLKHPSEDERIQKRKGCRCVKKMLQCKDGVIYFVLIMTILLTWPAWGSVIWFFIELATHRCDRDNIFFLSCPGSSIFFCSRCRIKDQGKAITKMKDRELSRRARRYAALCAST